MASTYLSRTISSDGNRKIMTFSAWIKRATASATTTVFATGTGSERDMILFESDGKLQFSRYSGSYLYILKTNRQFRDVNSWYHLMCVLDTTQGTESNRAKIYVNGVQETSLNTATYPSQDYQTNYNQNTFTQYLGQDSDGNFDFDGCMSHVHYVDGTAYTPSTFGSTDATTGEWKINTSPSVSYGTNGFFILKDGNSVTDQGGGSHNWTVASGTLTKTEDNPSNVFATLNALSTPSTLSNGNTKSVYGGSGSYAIATSTLGMTTGKWYCEVKINANSNYPSIGVCTTTSIQATKLSQSDWLGNSADSYGLFTTGGNVYNSANIVNTFGAIATNDIIGMALDLNSAQNTLKYYKNGSLIGTQNITTNTDGYMFAINTQSIGGGYGEFNFGNGYFGSTQISSAGTNASGIGIFEYDVPTGYTALSTKGLNL